MRRCFAYFAVLLLFGTGVACRRSRAPLAATEVRTPAANEGGAWQPLPDAISGFTAGPVETSIRAVNRTYVRAGARVTVTLARLSMNADQYAGWVRTSVEGFPQAHLDIPEGSGNGFYQCDEPTPASCSLLVQLRAGVHLEIRGSPASREDVDAIARGLPLRALALEGAASQGWRDQPK